MVFKAKKAVPYFKPLNANLPDFARSPLENHFLPAFYAVSFTSAGFGEGVLSLGMALVF